MASTWFRARRGLAVGTIVCALTVGKASPYLAQAIPGLGVFAISAGASELEAAEACILTPLSSDGAITEGLREVAAAGLTRHPNDEM